MKLVYTATGLPVQVGDRVTVGSSTAVVTYFAPPHKPAASGKVSVREVNLRASSEFYVSVIGAEWIEREDRHA